MPDPGPPEDRVDAGAPPAPIPTEPEGTVVTVGTFDGVHRGHWAVLGEVLQRARAAHRRSVLVTFDPHPLRIVRPEKAPPLLTTPVEKKEILAESGLDYAVFLTFTRALSRYTPELFVKEILVGRIGVRELVIGYDHGFGRGRTGDAATLRALGARHGFAVDVVDAVQGGTKPVSSSGIRDAVSAGRLREARSALGRPYSFRGVVIRGDGRGRALGFPTANLRVEDAHKLLPPPGIYAAFGVLRTGAVPGALHLGPRPTFKGSPPSVELHLMDFDGNLYGEEIRVDLIERLRDIRPFTTVDALVDRMAEDVEDARRVLRSEGTEAREDRPRP